MSVYEIPLKPMAQEFGISLAGVAYNLTLKWNKKIPTWVIDIADQNDVPILNGVPLVTGADLLAQYAYLGFGGSLLVQTDGNVGAIPTYDNLGTDSHVYFVTSP